MPTVLDKALFESEVSKYSAELYRYIYKKIHHTEQAKDILQETIARTFSYYKKHPFDLTTVRALMYRILKCAMVDEYRKSSFKVTMNSVPLEDPHVHILCTDVSHDFVLAERAVKAEVEKLPDKYRTIIECCYFNDLSYKSIAKNEKINVSTVRSRLSRAKAKLKHKKILRNCLEEYL